MNRYAMTCYVYGCPSMKLQILMTEYEMTDATLLTEYELTDAK